MWDNESKKKENSKKKLIKKCKVDKRWIYSLFYKTPLTPEDNGCKENEMLEAMFE